jgi:hypothetical protein
MLYSSGLVDAFLLLLQDCTLLFKSVYELFRLLVCDVSTCHDPPYLTGTMSVHIWNHNTSSGCETLAFPSPSYMRPWGFTVRDHVKSWRSGNAASKSRQELLSLYKIVVSRTILS